MTVGIILLAAGESKRLGRAKQLLPFRNSTLLSHAATQAVNSKAGKVFVVLGPRREECEKEIAGLSVSPIFNAEWQSGMASSIRAGVGAVLREESIGAVLITTCDQPRVGSDHLNELIDHFLEQKSELVATAYHNSFGIPALFGRKHFEALSRLEGDSGAKSILQEHLATLVRIPFEGAQHDIDTEADYKQLLQG